MTNNEASLVEAALNWRRIHGPATQMTSSAMKEVAVYAEMVIAERNRANQTNEPPSTAAKA